MFIIHKWDVVNLFCSIRLDRPKKNYLKMLINGNEQLRFEAVMATNNEIDKDRRFIISLRLSDDMIGTVFVSISNFFNNRFE